MKVVIFGATGDLGTAVASCLAAQGAELVLHGNKNKERLASLGQQYPDATLLTGDVRSEADVQRMIEQAGDFDAMVYAVGINPAPDMLAETSLDLWNDVLSVNVTGAFLALRHGLRALRKSEHGSVVLVSSIFGLETPERRVAYGAAKHAMTALVQGGAREEAGAVRINAVCPGPMWSENVRNIFAKHSMAANITLEEYVYERVKDIPMGRFAELRECADAVCYLLSDKASFINGETIRIAGGAVV